MTELDRDRDVRMRADRDEHLPQSVLVVIAIEAEVAVRDAALLRHRSGLDDQQARARKSELRQMRVMPGRRAALARRVLTHRGDHDAVRARQRTQAPWAKQQAHARSYFFARK